MCSKTFFFVQSFAQILEELASYCRRTTIILNKWYLTPQIELTLKPNNFNIKPRVILVPLPHKGQMSTLI